MFKKIAAVQPLSHGELIVWFVDGEARLLDTSALFAESEAQGALEDEDTFFSVKLAAEGYGISWGDQLDLGCKEIYENSRRVSVVGAESHRVISEVVDARHDAALSQAKLASAAGVKQPVVARLETGVNSPRLDTLLKILTPLGKTLQVIDLGDAVDGDVLKDTAEE